MNGKTLGENIATARVYNDDEIRENQWAWILIDSMQIMRNFSNERTETTAIFCTFFGMLIIGVACISALRLETNSYNLNLVWPYQVVRLFSQAIKIGISG